MGIDKEIIVEKVNEIIKEQNILGPGADRVIPNNKGLEEVTVAREFADAYDRQCGKNITNIRSNDQDPPDCLAEESGHILGIEITRIVKSEVWEDNKKEYYKAKQKGGGRELTKEESLQLQQDNHSRNYDKSQWSKEELIGRLQGTIRKKDQKLARCATDMRVILVIYTDDQNLPKTDLTSWLADAVFSAQNLKEVFLLGPHQAQNNKQIPPNPNDPNAWDKIAWVTPDYPLFRLQLTDNIRAS